jgi:SEC-C motif-containing protein
MCVIAPSSASIEFRDCCTAARRIGRLAQLVARFLHTEEVIGSSPVSPTIAADNGCVTSVLLHERCPCGSGLTYSECCAPAHTGVAPAPTAEQLMRSRYSAFVRGDVRYLLASWHPDTCPDSLELDPDQRWTSLEIVRRDRGGPLDSRGEVEFRARFRRNGVRGEQHERSRFVRLGRSWLYLDGIELPPTSPP